LPSFGEHGVIQEHKANFRQLEILRFLHEPYDECLVINKDIQSEERPLLDADVVLQLD
jgi:hypothetical protein